MASRRDREAGAAKDVPSETGTLARRYLDLLLATRRNEALDLVLDAVAAGLAVSEVYLGLVQPVMYEVGRLWQTDKIDIGTEHYCTAATQLLMARLFPLALARGRGCHTMVGCCVGSELHELGMRMVCDFFEFHGWDTYFMGANTPPGSVLKALGPRPADLLCLSATMGYGVPLIRDIIRLVRETFGPDRPRIMVGGLPFLISPGLIRLVGADATAADARMAVAQAEQLVEPCRVEKD